MTTLDATGQEAELAKQSCQYDDLWGHPKPLWMLFMAEFWERFAFYGIRWALTLYIVAQFFNGDASGQTFASNTYGAYLALVYGSAIFGGYVADKIIGSQHAILTGALIMAAGLFLLMLPDQTFFMLGLATVIIGNGLFKPNISNLVGKIYQQGDPRRDRGFSIFYMGINAGAMISPIVTQYLASTLTDTPMMDNYKVVFAAAGIGMVISYCWFYLGRRQLKGTGAIAKSPRRSKNLVYVITGAALSIVPVYLLMAYAGAQVLAWILFILFVGLAAMLIKGAKKEGKVALDRVLACLIMCGFNVIFFMFFEQAGSSFTFLAQNLVDRSLGGGFEFKLAWFQSVNAVAILLLAPLLSLIWLKMSRRNLEPNIPQKFALGLLGTGAGFLVLVFALENLLDVNRLIPLWPLAACYVLHTVGELCLSPIGLSMVSKLVPASMAGLAFGGWFLSTAIGNNFSGILAGSISGETGMTVASAISGFDFSFWLLTGGGLLLFILAPLINKLMHGVK
ncbi:peptide MFS transporter [Thalassomonas actiniarum]|uniref:MFS transporter n=1 Tax=Thalassomonas actiniarum TaxID=485447 RepID=A0AAE9YQL7_9GAMM|nr:oligopeptide:H+ symporter [Thalassomonas actiniarum]WDD99046.1 MFS transporter [Thalassomonas actiniarum]